MAALDDFKAEYARQHPRRPEKELWSDEALVIAACMDRLRNSFSAFRHGFCRDE